jgi:hypothetical protein
LIIKIVYLIDVSSPRLTGELCLRGKPWSNGEIRQLRRLVNEGKNVNDISRIMHITRVSVRAKLYNMGLTLKDAAIDLQNPIAAAASSPISSTPEVSEDNNAVAANLKVTGSLPSIEEKLRVLDAALVAMEQPGLSAVEVSRLNKIVLGVKVYQELFVDFVNYRELEAEVLELRRQLAAERDKK